MCANMSLSPEAPPTPSTSPNSCYSTLALQCQLLPESLPATPFTPLKISPSIWKTLLNIFLYFWYIFWRFGLTSTAYGSQVLIFFSSSSSPTPGIYLSYHPPVSGSSSHFIRVVPSLSVLSRLDLSSMSGLYPALPIHSFGCILIFLSYILANNSIAEIPSHSL
jgi:hypothetical protein